ATDAGQALQELQRADFDTVVCDVRMPGTSGLELLQTLRRTDRTRDLPVIMLTGVEDRDVRRQALDLGATDLLNKPADQDELIARIRSALRLKSYQDNLKAQNEILEATVLKRTAELVHSRMDIIWRLGKAAEYRDEDTGNHVARVGCYCRVIAETLGLPKGRVEMIFLASPLHDIGKIGIPDHVLLKPETLTPREWSIMQRHCEIGARILQQQSKAMDAYEAWSGKGLRPLNPENTAPHNPLLEMASMIALYHHERWDGLGYPTGLQGTAIPLEARIVAIADSYDALLSDRPYRAGFPEDVVLRTIRESAGHHFDPDVYVAFAKSIEQLREIRNEMTDRQGHRAPPLEPREHVLSGALHLESQVSA
ncbi:MAG: HD domain-containing phosphohydrolase, partial [candidate division NC10 bacterium]